MAVPVADRGARLSAVTGATPVLVADGSVPAAGVIELAVAGDRRAVGQVLAFVRPVVVRYCRVRLGWTDRGGTSADDVAQEVCLVLLKALPGYRDEGRPFLAYVYGIAAHKVADALRHAARHHADPVPQVPEAAAPDLTPEERALGRERSVRMAELLRMLPEHKREILILRIVVGLSAQETAEAVGCTAGAVRVTQHRALTMLRSALATKDDI